MKQNFTTVIAITLVALGSLAPSAAASDYEFEFTQSAAIALTDPPLPTYPLHLILDDDTPDGEIGISSGGMAKQFLWFNRFAVPAYPMELSEIWILFPPGANISAGNDVQLVIYFDIDQDPLTGAELLAAYDETIQVADGLTFSVYTLPSPIIIDAFGDVLVGVVSRFVTSGVTSPTQPASIDTSSSMARSWIAVWAGDPPNPPLLPADDLYTLVDTFQPGNWMIRAFGNQLVRPAIPIMGRAGRAALVLLVVFTGIWVIRRRG